MTYINITEQARRYREIESYVKNWPYSPYIDLEYRELARFVRNMITVGKGDK